MMTGDFLCLPVCKQTFCVDREGCFVYFTDFTVTGDPC